MNMLYECYGLAPEVTQRRIGKIPRDTSADGGQK